MQDAVIVLELKQYPNENKFKTEITKKINNLEDIHYNLIFTDKLNLGKEKMREKIMKIWSKITNDNVNILETEYLGLSEIINISEKQIEIEKIENKEHTIKNIFKDVHILCMYANQMFDEYNQLAIITVTSERDIKRLQTILNLMEKEELNMDIEREEKAFLLSIQEIKKENNYSTFLTIAKKMKKKLLENQSEIQMTIYFIDLVRTRIRKFINHLKEMNESERKKYIEANTLDIIKIENFFSNIKNKTLSTIFENLFERTLHTIINHNKEEKALNYNTLKIQIGNNFMREIIKVTLEEQKKEKKENEIAELKETAQLLKKFLKRESSITLEHFGQPFTVSLFEEAFKKVITVININENLLQTHIVYFKVLIDLTEEEYKYIAKKNMDLCPTLFPPCDWEVKEGEDITKNTTGGFFYNKTEYLKNMVVVHFPDKHEVKIEASDSEIVRSLNMYQSTPYCVNRKTFDFALSEENHEFISEEAFENAKKEPTIKENQEIMSEKYQQNTFSKCFEILYQDKIKVEENVFKKLELLGGDMKEIKKFTLKNELIVYFPINMTFTGRLNPITNMHYLLDKNVRYCLRSVCYALIEESEEILLKRTFAIHYSKEKLAEDDQLNYFNKLDLKNLDLKKAKSPVQAFAVLEILQNLKQENNYSNFSFQFDCASSVIQIISAIIHNGKFKFQLKMAEGADKSYYYEQMLNFVKWLKLLSDTQKKDIIELFFALKNGKSINVNMSTIEDKHEGVDFNSLDSENQEIYEEIMTILESKKKNDDIYLNAGTAAYFLLIEIFKIKNLKAFLTEISKAFQMPIAYGAGFKTVAESVEQLLRKYGAKNSNLYKSRIILIKLLFYYTTKKNINILFTSFLLKISNFFGALKIPLKIKGMTGLEIKLDYREFGKTKPKRIEQMVLDITTGKKVRKTITINDDLIFDKKKLGRSFAALFVHQNDASINAKIRCNTKVKNNDIKSIHDCFTCDAYGIKKVKIAIREAFANIFFYENDINKGFLINNLNIWFQQLDEIKKTDKINQKQIDDLKKKIINILIKIRNHDQFEQIEIKDILFAEFTNLS